MKVCFGDIVFVLVICGLMYFTVMALFGATG